MDNRWRFPLAAVAILLAGAIAAGLAANAVVSPAADRVQSAGTVSIPTVLGQTAEEVLFFPWSMYDTERLYPVSEGGVVDIFDLSPVYGGTVKAAAKSLEEIGGQANGNPLLSMITVFSSFEGLEFSWEELFSSLEWNVPPQEDGPDSVHLFLRDLPARRSWGDTVPVTFSFALGEDSGLGAVSCLIRPEKAETVTQEQQEAALRQVDSDLRSIFRYGHDPQSSNMSILLMEFFGSLYESTTYEYRLENFFPWWELEADTPYLWGSYDQAVLKEWSMLHGTWMPEENYFAEDPDLSLEEFLSSAGSLWNFTGIQIVNTQQQILVLFTVNTGLVFGVYYDVQLGCWSGAGIMS